MDLNAALKSFAKETKSLRHSREGVTGEAVLLVPGVESPVVGGATNLSIGGVGVRLDRRTPALQVGEKVQVTLRWPDGDQVVAGADIAWQGPTDAGGASYGLVFRDLDEASLKHINRHLISRVVDRHLSSE